MLANHMNRAGLRRNPIRNAFPGIAVVRRHVNVPGEVVASVVIERHIGGPLVVARGHHAADIGALTHARDLSHGVAPRLAAIAGHLDVAVIGASPDHSRTRRGLAESRDAGELLYAIMPRER